MSGKLVSGILAVATVVTIATTGRGLDSQASGSALGRTHTLRQSARGALSNGLASADDANAVKAASGVRSSPAVRASVRVKPSAADVDPAALTAVVRRYCQVCHNDAMLTGNLSLQDFDVATSAEMPQTAEKMIVKLRLDMMPPPGMPRPGGDTLAALVETLERTIEKSVAANPNPGLRLIQRLNQAEYERTIRDLLGLEVDASDFLPPETVSDNFDNISDVQILSPALLEGYMRAASHVARMAVGDAGAAPVQVTYRVPFTTNQHDWVEATPYGSRGGISVVHNFPADASYIFRIDLHPALTPLYGRHSRGERIELSNNGERVALMEVDRFARLSEPEGHSVTTEPIPVRAGPQRVAAAFIPTFEGPINDLLAPVEHTMSEIGRSPGITTLPHLRDLRIAGPYDATGVSATPSRERIFTCRPLTPAEEGPCAQEIIRRLAEGAYRRPLVQEDVDELMQLYEQGTEEGGFEAGIALALQAILASPHFVFRIDRQPRGLAQGEIYPLSDLSLASRLSYFLWASRPDQELIELAREGRLSDRKVLEQQARRMLADPRAEALASRFAAQWLRLPRLNVIHPDPQIHPEFDDRLRDVMRRETELLFDNLVREDRSVLELLSADYTFVNQRLAEHYGIPGIVGPEFRRVEVTDPNRRGLGILGHGSVLMLTSQANRTSPVDRGKWVMEVLLGTSPPPPPPAVPTLEETPGADEENGRVLTVRERMEKHRTNPTCNACHQFIDPLGLPLENYGITGRWRIRDQGNPVDPRGKLWNGTELASPQDLRTAILGGMEVAFVRSFTENLMRYALGRRVHYYDQPAIRRIAREAAARDYRMSSFILGIVLSDQFRMRVAEPLAAVNQSR